MSEPEGRRWCYGKMNHPKRLVCHDCPDRKECFLLTCEHLDEKEDEP